MTQIVSEGVQNKRGTKSLLASTNDILKAGEVGYITDDDRTIMGDGSTYGKNRPHFLDSNQEAYIAGLDGMYTGKDLTTLYNKENAGSTYSSIWAWLHARIGANNFEGIHVGDYIPIALSAGTITDGTTTYSITAKTLNAQIAGINTYEHYGDTEVPKHIDFITKEGIGTNIPWNPANNNNGTSVQENPWLASKIYACLNGVNNYSTSAYNSVAHGFAVQNSTGVLQLLPAALQTYIVEKRMYAPKRYSNSGLLTESTSGAWVNYGKLWLPTEMEAYGCPMHTDVNHTNEGKNWDCMGSIPYALFRDGRAPRNKSRVSWWLSSVPSGSSTHACTVYTSGSAYAYGCIYTNHTAPVCFRIV